MDRDPADGCEATMTSVKPARTEPTASVPSLPAARAAALEADDVLARLGSRTAACRRTRRPAGFRW